WFIYFRLLYSDLFFCVSDGDVLYANLGDDVSLPCFFTSSATHLSWYKQVAGEQPRIISSFYKSSLNSNIFYNQFKDNRRFSVDTGGGFYNLNISNIQDSDSAMYSCSYTRVSVTIFISGTLHLKNNMLHLFYFCSEPGNSVTLNCTLLTGTSDGEHSAYWFKDSGKSHLGMLYTSSRQCVRSSEWGSPALRCVYSLSKRNVSLFDAGTYYCAVASCGQILFGTGTRLSVEGEQQIHFLYPPFFPFFSYFLCVDRKPNEGFTVVQYAALDFKKRQDRSSRQKNTEEETIYSRVRRSELE
uniref:Ig-like domain-containing protein n=1 Tax=Kryptolebias marmoratus TaxID=37003 RepID=A0A3Q3GIT4_KRYMA